MSGIGIGASDRGAFDREDQLYIKPNALKTNVTAKEAEDFAKANSGAEAIIKNAQGLYSVYQLETSEDKKTVPNSDFKDDSIKLTADVAKQFTNGKKAYVATTDNVIRNLEIDGLELPNVDHDFVRGNLNITLEDKDGIDTKSKNDIEGKISGNISISKESIEKALKDASKKYGVDLRLSSINPAKNEYEISVGYGANLANITIKMESGGIKAKVDSSILVASLATVLGGPLAGPAINNAAENKATSALKEGLSKGLGLKVVPGASGNQIKLIPDFKDSPLFSKIPVGDMNLHIEEIQASGTSFKLDGRGDVQINLDNAKIIGSSDVNATPITALDKEGPDKIKANITANLSNDFTAKISSKSSADVNITEEEQANIAARMKKMSGMGISASGKVSISDVKVDAEINSDHQLNITKQQSGNIKAENINVKMGDATLNIASTSGALSLQQDNKKIILDAKGVELKGGIRSPESNVDFKEMKLTGKITYDSDNPGKIKLESDTNQAGIQLSIDVKSPDKKNVVSIDKFTLTGADIEFDVNKGNMSMAQKGTAPATLNNLKIGESIDLNNITFKGKLDIDAIKGKLVLDSKDISFKGKLGNIEFTDLKCSGKLTYDDKGVKIENINVANAKGKVGNFDISELKGSANLQFDKDGNLVLSDASDLQLNSKNGLKLRGDAVVSHKDGIFDIKTRPNKPLNISYKPEGSKDKLNASGLVIDGNIKYDSNANTFSFNNGSQPLVLRKGSIAGVKFDNFKLNGEVNLGKDGTVTINNTTGPVSFSGGIDGMKLKEFKSTGAITLDPKNNLISTNGEVSLDIPDKKLQVSSKGNISFNQEKDGKYVLTSKDGVINAKFGNIDLKDFKLEGKVTFDPKNNEVKFFGLDGNDMKVSGMIQGKKFDLESSGAVGFSQADGNIKLATQGVKVNGTIEGFNIKSEEGVKGEVSLSPEGKLLNVSGFKMDLNVDGISLISNGDVSGTASGYQVKLSGDVAADDGKISAFFDKLVASSFVPEGSKKSLVDIQQQLKEINANKIKYQDFTINLDKDFGFNDLKITTKGIDLNIPISKYKLSSTGDVTFEIKKDGKMSASTKDAVINATLDGTDFKNFKLNGSINYDPKTGTMDLQGHDGNDVKISGFIENKQLDLAAKGGLKIDRNPKGEVQLAGNNIKVNGMIDGFKVESLSDASGKILIKNNGHMDMTNLKFEFKVDDVIISNKNGSINGNDDGYDLKFQGNVNSNRENLLKFMEKISVNESIPPVTRKTIDETVKNVRNYINFTDLKNGKYENFHLKLDRDLNFKDFQADISGSTTKTGFKLGIHGAPGVLNAGNVDIKAHVSSSNDEFKIKNGNVSFALTKEVKDSIAKMAADIFKSYDLHDLDITVKDNGDIKLNKATYKKIPIIDIDIAVTTKFQGTKMILALEEANVQGFLGRLVQKVVEGGFGVDGKQIGIEKIMPKATDIKMNYNKGEHSIALDFRDVFYEQIGDDVELKSMGAKDGKFQLNFDVNVGGSKPFNPTKVRESVEQIREILRDNHPKNEKRNSETLKNIIINSDPQDLTRMLDRVTLFALKEKLKDNSKVVDVLEKIAKNAEVGHNNEHLREMTTYINDDTSRGLERRLGSEHLHKIAPEAKANLVNHLFKDDTNGDEEQSSKRMILNTRGEDLSRLFAKVSPKKMEDELDSKDFLDVMVKLIDNSHTGNNDWYLQQCLKAADDDDMTSALINRYSDQQIAALSVGTKVQMIKILANGDTNAAEEQRIKRLIMVSSPADARQIIKSVTLNLLKDELEKKDVNDILRVANRH